MIEKYRVHELAKDLNVPTKDIVAMLEANFPGEPKKHMTVLTDDELNYVFESYTQKNESKNLDEYFALKNQKKELPKEKKDEHGKKEEPVRQAKPAREEKPAVSDTVTEKPEKTEKTERTEKAAPVSSQPVSEQLTEKKQQSAPAASTRPVDPAVANFKPGQRTYNRPNERGGAGSPRNMQQGTRPADRTGSAPTGGQRPYGNNNQQGGRFGDRSGGAAAGTQRSYNNNQQNGRFGDRAGTPAGSQRPYGNNQQGGRFNDRSNDRFGGNRTQGGQRPQQNAAPAKPAAPAAPVIPNDGTPIEIKVRQPKAKLPKGERVQQGTTVTNVIVDMRSSEVDLDKYNERYEQIAPASSSKDTMLKKQKLNQKSAQRKGKPFMSRKEKEDQKLHRLQLERERREKLEVALPEEISVGDLAALLKVQASEIIKRLMPLGIMASISQVIDYDTAALVSMEIGAKVTKEVVVTIEDRLFDESEDSEENLIERSPVVVVMGHVDHGKTSLLDAIRNTSVVSGEAGGITQHIGAYQVELNGRTITFLDTPGHAAFTSMRARGAQITDIAVLVVAADDGIMPQTIEAINHAKAAGVTAIVAINKMDKPHANPDRVMQQLTEHNLLPEAWGGDTICVPVSAKTRMGIDDLLENILLVADIKELKANPDRLARGTVVEAKLDKGRGPVATVLVQNGTLHTGDVIIAGTSVGRVRNMTDDKGNKVQSAGPSQPVEITGLAEVPAAGDQFNAVEDERLARELVEKRRMEAKEEQFKSYQKVTLDNLFEHISEGEMKELPIIVKADVQGSVEAVKQSLEKLSNDEVRVSVIHAAVGSVKESDVMLANASGAIIIGFNVRPDPTAKENAERDGVDIRLYRIIYDAIEEVEAAIKGMLTPKTKEVDIGRAEVRQVYTITNVGKVAGCYVLSGKICRGVNIRLVRDGIILTDVKLASLKRFKDDVREVASGYECGITLEKYADIKEGDIFEAYEIQQVTE